MAKREGKENTSAGQCILFAKKMLSIPIENAAINDAEAISNEVLCNKQ